MIKLPLQYNLYSIDTLLRQGTAISHSYSLIILDYFRSSTMSTTVADLPKDLLIAEGLKGELLKEHNLKPTEATEKNVLPSAEDVQQEKTHQNILTGKLQGNT